MLLWDSQYSPHLRRSILFGTPHSMSDAGDAEHFIVDGIFKSSPNLFTQLFTVHGVFPNGWHYPICYDLLPGKTTVLYKNLLAAIDTFGRFQPQLVQCDHDIGIHNAIAEVWPFSTRRGCYFHHKKSLWKHLQQLDLTEEYAVPGSDIRKYFKMMGALAFVPEDDVRRVWRLLKPLIPDDMLQFISFYETTWIGTINVPVEEMF